MRLSSIARVFLSATLALIAIVAKSADTKPNIVFILSDDQGYSLHAEMRARNSASVGRKSMRARQFGRDASPLRILV